MPGRQLPDRFEDRARARDVLQRQVRVDRFRAPVARHVGVLEQRLDLRSERDAVPCRAVVERLDAQSIADEQQAAVRLVPEREREHAAESIDGRVAPLLVCVHDDFGVCVRAEAMAARHEIRAHVGEVVDLAVEDHPDRAVLVGDRLVAGREVDDAQAAEAEADARPRVEAVGIGAAVRDDRGHRRQRVPIDGTIGVEVELSGDSAHVRRWPAGEKARGSDRGA